jgi:hypothetical protein
VDRFLVVPAVGASGRSEPLQSFESTLAGCGAACADGPACANGIDDDGDGLSDYPADPGCRFPSEATEAPPCQDGVHNDGDARVDFDGGASAHGGVATRPADPTCAKPWTSSERSRCGLGFELVALLPLLDRLRRSRSPTPRSRDA